jgi:hypothetical protein
MSLYLDWIFTASFMFVKLFMRVKIIIYAMYYIMIGSYNKLAY